MSRAKGLLIRFVSMIIIMSIADKIPAQESEIDTTSYISSFFTGSLEYNLMIASSLGFPSEIDRLISKGADIDAETIEKATPLIFAVSNNHLAAVKALLTHDPNFNQITSSFETPLLIAVKNQNIEIAEALLRAGADIDISDNHGAAALHYAALYGYFYVTDLLLYYEASVDKKSLDGTTPLMAAILAGYADVADLLIQNGSNMEARDENGFTPLLIAAQNNDTIIMDLLIRRGVDIYELNKYNYDALAISIKTNQYDATQFLLKKAPDWTLREKEAPDPYYVASKYRRTEIAGLLKKYNVPGEPKPKVDQMEASVSSKFNLYDIYTGFILSFREPMINAGVIAGFDSKLWYTRIMIEESENTFIQYREKRSVAYVGLFKDFALTDNPFRGNFLISTSLSVAYTFGNKFRGTNITPVEKLMIIPSAGIKWEKKNIGFSAGVEYMRTGYYKNGPMWGRTGFSYFFFFDKVRAPAKTIRWN